MTTTTTTIHIGKIARLAKEVREELGRRLEDGEPGPALLKWLNGRQDVQAILRGQFGGRAVNKQNLSAWRRSGHVAWRALEEQRRSLRQVVTETNELVKAVGKRSLGTGLAIKLAVELHGLAKTLLDQESDPVKRWERVRQLHREVSRLRRDDDRVRRTELREKRDKALGKARGSRLRAEGGDEDAAYWNQQEPPPQGIEAAREAAAAMGGCPSWQGYGAEHEDEHEDEQMAGEDGLSLVKAGQGGNEVKNAGAGMKLPRIVERLASPNPGCEYVRVRDKRNWLWFEEVPKGWEVPEDWKAPDQQAEFERAIRNGLTLGEKEAEQARNTGLEAEARPALPVNPEAGKPGPQGEEGRNPRAEIRNKSEGRNPNSKVKEQVGWLGLPYVPDPDPEVEAYNRWWRMNRNLEPFDHEELQRVYAELPRKMAEFKVRLMCEAAGNVECMEGAGI